MDRHQGDNIGTFHKIYIAKVKNLTSVNFDAQKFEEIYFTPQTGQWQRKTKASKNGNYFEHNLNFDVPKFRDDVETTILDYVRVALIAYIVLTNGESVRIGSLQSPLFILADVTAGKNYPDFNSYSFKGPANEAINMTKNSSIVVSPPPPPPLPKAKGLNFNAASNTLYVKIQRVFSFNAWTLVFKIRKINTISNAPNTYGLSTLFSGSTLTNLLGITEYGLNFYATPLVNKQMVNGTDIFIVCKYDGTSLTGIVDNAVGNPITVANPLLNSNMFIGQRGDSVFHFFNQIMKDLKIYNKALSPTESTALYNARANDGFILTSAANNFINHYRFNDKQGTVLKDYVSGHDANLFNVQSPEVTFGQQNLWLYTDNTPVLS